MENESSITEFVLEPSKTYHIGDGDGFRIYLQVVHFEKEDYSIRVIIGGEDFHSKFIKRGYIWDIQQGLNKEDFIFKTPQEAETKLAGIIDVVKTGTHIDLDTLLADV